MFDLYHKSGKGKDHCFYLESEAIMQIKCVAQCHIPVHNKNSKITNFRAMFFAVVFKTVLIIMNN